MKTIDKKLKNDINIALFMGYEKCSIEYQMKWTSADTKERLERLDHSYIPLVCKEGSEPLFDTSFDYDTNWSHLMPVVKKITDIAKECNFFAKTKAREFYLAIGHQGLLNVDIDVVYENVVKLITWYNSQK